MSRTNSPSSRLLGVAVGLAVLAVALGLWWVGSADEPEVDLGPGEVHASARDAAAGNDATTDESVREVDAGAAAFAKDGGVGTAEATATEVRTRYHVLVRVIDGTTKAPVPDVEVVADAFEQDPLRRSSDWSAATFERNRSEGEKGVTDAEGRVWLRLRDGVRVAASKGDRFGMRWFQLEALVPEGFEVRLEPLESVTVRVKGVDGLPRADVPIGVSVRYVGGELAPVVDVLPVGSTDANGQLELRLAEFVRPGLRPDGLEVRLRAPGFVNVEQQVAPGQREVDLVIPPYGSVLVRALRANGEPFPELPVWSATLRPADFENEPLDEQVSGTVKDGAVCFPYVALGKELEVTCSASAGWLSERIPGPRTAGQQVVHTFTVDDTERFFVTGRVLDAKGEPIQRARAMCLVDEQAVSSGQLDKDGRFAIPFGLPEGPKTCTVRLVVSAEKVGFAAFAPVALQTGRTHDFGELVMQTSEPIATGVVVADAPIGPAVWLWVEAPEGEGWSRSERFAVDLHDDGAFEVHHLAGAGTATVEPRLRLSARANGFVAVPPIEFRPGQSLRVELKRGPEFRARLLLDPAIEWFVARSGLDLLLTAQDGESDYLHGRLVDGEWVFESSGVTPGIYAIALESGSAVDDLAQMEGVRIFADEEPDPRLLPWDLRSTVQMLTVRLRKEDGSRLDASGEVYRRRALDGEWENCCSFENGVAQSISTAVPVDLFLDLDGYGFLRRTGVLGTLDLVVPDPKKVEIAFAGLPRLKPGTHLGLSVEVAEGWPRGNGLPEWASPLIDYDWNETAQRLVVTVSQPVDVQVEFRRQSEQELPILGTLRVAIPADGKPLEVACPREVAAALQPFAEVRPGGSR